MNHYTRRRATKPRLRGEAKRQIRAHVGERDGWHCHYCRLPFPGRRGVTLDHYLPHCLWPMNRPRNLVLACLPCNRAKADQLPFTLAWLLTHHAAYRQVSTPTAEVFTAGVGVFTADPTVFTAAARLRAAGIVGRAVGARQSPDWSVVFTLSARQRADDPRGCAATGRVGRAAARQAVGCRALVVSPVHGRHLTWKPAPTEGVVNTVQSGVVGRVEPTRHTRCDADCDAVTPGVTPTVTVGPTVAVACVTRVVNTVTPAVNTPQPVAESGAESGTTGRVEPTRHTDCDADCDAVTPGVTPAVNTQPSAMNTHQLTVNTDESAVNTAAVWGWAA